MPAAPRVAQMRRAPLGLAAVFDPRMGDLGVHPPDRELHSLAAGTAPPSQAGRMLIATYMGRWNSMFFAGEPWEEDRVGRNVLQHNRAWDLGGPPC